jgi:phage terminase large subunit
MYQGRIKILDTVKEFRMEAEGYVWDDSADEDKPIKENDHMLDLIRYFVKTKRIAKVRRDGEGTSIFY